MDDLADAIVLVHGAFVAYVVGGAAYIWLGAAFGWRGVRNRWFRGCHLAAIAFVALQSLLGYECPLTVWEARLRGASTDPAFIARLVHRAIFYDLPGWVFTLTYVLFALALVLTWIVLPPRSRPSTDRQRR